MARPDFSGEWKLNPEASRLSPIVAPAVRSGSLRIAHDEPRFKAHQTVVFESGPVDSKFEMVADGRETVTEDGRGQTIVSSLRWDGEALLAAWRIHGPGFEMTISFRYELIENGLGLQAAEELRGGGRDQDNVWVFERARGVQE